MKLFLLLLAIFVATELVMSDACWKDGHCRVVCKDGEDSVIRCQNHKRCCVPERYLTLPAMIIDEGVLGKNPILQCMGNRGFCRSSCKKEEQPYFYCRNYLTCCLEPYVRISLSGMDKDTKWSYEKHWPKIP